MKFTYLNITFQNTRPRGVCSATFTIGKSGNSQLTWEALLSLYGNSSLAFYYVIVYAAALPYCVGGALTLLAENVFADISGTAGSSLMKFSKFAKN